jgi:hypothetical protein
MKKMDFNFDIEKLEQFFYNNLNEKDKRLYVGLESMKIGYYGVHNISSKYKINKHYCSQRSERIIVTRCCY